MNRLIIFVNLFFVPTLTLYLGLLCKRRPAVPSWKLFFPYCAAVCVNLILTKALLYFLRVVTGIYPPVDSILYTLAASVSACILALAVLIVGQLHIEINVSRIGDDYENSSQETEF